MTKGDASEASGSRAHGVVRHRTITRCFPMGDGWSACTHVSSMVANQGMLSTLHFAYLPSWGWVGMGAHKGVLLRGRGGASPLGLA